MELNNQIKYSTVISKEMIIYYFALMRQKEGVSKEDIFTEIQERFMGINKQHAT